MVDACSGVRKAEGSSYREGEDMKTSVVHRKQGIEKWNGVVGVQQAISSDAGVLNDV